MTKITKTISKELKAKIAYEIQGELNSYQDGEREYPTTEEMWEHCLHVIGSGLAYQGKEPIVKIIESILNSNPAAPIIKENKKNKEETKMTKTTKTTKTAKTAVPAKTEIAKVAKTIKAVKEVKVLAETNPNEVWKAIEGHEGYEVSNLGNVKALNYRNKGAAVLVKLRQSKSGSIKARISVEGKGKKFQVHRLVAEAFLPNPNSAKRINHKDGDKGNNSAENLEWVPTKEKAPKAKKEVEEVKEVKEVKTPKTPKTPKAEKAEKAPTVKRVQAIVATNVKTGEKTNYFTNEEIVGAGFDKYAVKNVLDGKAKSHKGFTWVLTKVEVEG